ncbi:hypothetical protein HaLaN_31050, partial [Haematococcus lacustris]
RAQPMNAKMLVVAAAQYVQEVNGAAVVSNLMQALVAAGEARCNRLHQQLGAACNVTSQGNGVTAAEQDSREQAGEASVVEERSIQPQQASDVARACEAVLTKVNALLGTPSKAAAAAQEHPPDGGV